MPPDCGTFLTPMFSRSKGCVFFSTQIHDDAILFRCYHCNGGDLSQTVKDKLETCFYRTTSLFRDRRIFISHLCQCRLTHLVLLKFCNCVKCFCNGFMSDNTLSDSRFFLQSGKLLILSWSNTAISDRLCFAKMKPCAFVLRRKICNPLHVDVIRSAR